MSAPTCEQVDNVRRLADGLRKVAREWPEHFNMDVFIGERDGGWLSAGVVESHKSGRHPAECGTTGCALGWAPYILGVPTQATATDGWIAYARDVLGVADIVDFEILFYRWGDPYDPLPVADRLDAWADRHAGDCA